MDVCQSAVDAIMVVGEPFVIKAEQVEDGSVKIVHGGDILLGLPAEGIGRSIRVGGVDAGSGEPSGEARGVVIAPAGPFLESGHAAELGTPDHKDVVEHTAGLEVADEGGGGLVEDVGVSGVLGLDLLVSVPVADAFAHGIGSIEELDEADAFFQESPGEDAITCETGPILVLGVVGPVFLHYGSGFLGEIGHLRYGHLHAGSQFVAGDAGGQFGVSGILLEVAFVDTLEKVTSVGIGFTCKLIRGKEMPDFLGGAESCALKLGGQKSV